VSEAPLNPHTRVDPTAVWRAAQAAHGARTSPARGGLDRSYASPTDVPLSQLISHVRHVNPLLLMGSPVRSEYARKLHEGQQARSAEQLRRMRSLAPPLEPLEPATVHTTAVGAAHANRVHIR
jgi:hypothetical protein